MAKAPPPDRAALEQALVAAGHADVEGKAEALASFSPADLKKAADFAAAQEAENPFVEYRFEIAGSPPVAKRPRMSKFGKKVFAPDADDQLILGQLIQQQIPRGTVPMEGPVEFYMDVYKQMPTMPEFKRALALIGYLRPETKPDFDNYAKIAVDAMLRRAFKDDGQVIDGHIRKFYSNRPRIEILVVGRQRRVNK